MPYKTQIVPNKLFFRYKGITVYHTYKDDQFHRGTDPVFYTVNRFGLEDTAFDIRNIRGVHFREMDSLPRGDKELLKLCIDKGIITVNGYRETGRCIACELQE